MKSSTRFHGEHTESSRMGSGDELSLPLIGFAFNTKVFIVPLSMILLALSGCSAKQKSPEPVAAPAPQASAAPAPAAAPAPPPATLESTDADTARQKTALALPKTYGRLTGDWDQILKRGALRVLVINNRTGFFYDKGRPRGAIAEAMEEFGIIINKQLKTGAKKFVVVYLPMPPGQILAALNDGVGDIACTGIIITPEREKLVDFTVPLLDDVKLVLVTSKTAPAINSVDDLSG